MLAETVDVNGRKLVTVRQINALTPIEGADAIEVATVEGWRVVVKKGEFNVGDHCVYFEIDSFLPDGNPAWQFLVDKSPRIFEGVRGHKLRTIRLRGQISQGFVMPLTALPQVRAEWDRLCLEAPHAGGGIRDVDFSGVLGIVKWEAQLPACLAGQAEGLFPSFIPKTDQERVQNLRARVFGYTDELVPFDTTNIPLDALEAMRNRGELVWNEADSKWNKVLKAQASPDDRYEVSLKLDGSSMTAFARARFAEPVMAEDGIQNPIDTGVCSRNLQLKVSEENSGNSFVSVAIESGLLRALEKLAEDGQDLAVQGELMGPGIQGNRDELKTFQMFIFEIFDIRAGKKLAPSARRAVVKQLQELGAAVQHAPVLHCGATLAELGIVDIASALKFAEGPSIKHAVREGVVFKRIDGQFSFKVISDLFLAKEKD
jgi:hypothetical protein